MNNIYTNIKYYLKKSFSNGKISPKNNIKKRIYSIIDVNCFYWENINTNIILKKFQLIRTPKFEFEGRIERALEFYIARAHSTSEKWNVSKVKPHFHLLGRHHTWRGYTNYLYSRKKRWVLLGERGYNVF